MICIGSQSVITALAANRAGTLLVANLMENWNNISDGRLILLPWSSWTANSDKKYTELNGAALNVNKPCVTFRKQPFRKISRGRKWKIVVTLL